MPDTPSPAASRVERLEQENAAQDHALKGYRQAAATSIECTMQLTQDLSDARRDWEALHAEVERLRHQDDVWALQGGPTDLSESSSADSRTTHNLASTGLTVAEYRIVAARDLAEQRVAELEDILKSLPITKEQASHADALIEQYAPAAESTTAVQVALSDLKLWIESGGKYPRKL